MQPNNVYDYTDVGRSAVSQNTVLRKTYGLLGLSFLPAAAGAFLAMSTGLSLFSFTGNRWIAIGIFFAFFYGMSFLIEKNRYSNVGAALLMVLTFGLGFTLGPILNYSLALSNGIELVGIAAVMTAAVFLSMAAMAKSATFETNSIARFVSVGFVVAMIAMVASFFLNIPALSLAVSGLFVMVSSVLIMWQVRVLIEGGEDSHISAALTLFVAIYNIFTGLLRLLLAFAGEE
ncbi:Bax inhibitor-1 family protein [Eikenella sp. S3360]|uniref:Bax inhibitor-1 family protein n=1 Tax=Eikenella glucosivorans TaxID=2766967 RepID=A0ABS0NDB1_9NEIS|nr:Bax inhibitor-1 family protein [Eikenella glucosivorans]MBH5330313.1 Bax inhibitor-1 family protein [Eikenella glucosivorans]